MLFREIISAFVLRERENHKKHTDTLLRKCRILLLLKHMVHMVTTGLYGVKTTYIYKVSYVNYIIQPASTGFLLGLLFDPADGGNVFL
jgi:hypothetical protein